MTELTLLERGKPYPLPINHINNGEGAAAQFLTKTGNILQIVLSCLDAGEKTALRSGILYESGALLFLFQFHGRDGNPLIMLDAPFDIRILPVTERNLPNIDNPEQRLAIEIHAMDEKNILRALRLVTMPPDMTLAFLSAVQDQLAAVDKPGVMAKWMQVEPQDRIRRMQTWVLGK